MISKLEIYLKKIQMNFLSRIFFSVKILKDKKINSDNLKFFYLSRSIILQ